MNKPTNNTTANTSAPGRASSEAGEWLSLFSRGQEILAHAYALRRLTEEKVSKLLREQRHQGAKGA